MSENDLGRGYDDVDIFGLDEYGDPQGLGALWGAAVGVGAGTLAAIGGRSFGSMSVKNSELLGLGVAVAAGGVMAAFKGTRHAGWVAIASGLLGNGLRTIEAYMSAGTTGHYSGVQFQQIPRISAGMNGLGMIQAQPMNGQMGMNGLADSRRSLQLMGGPPVSPLAARYGHTSVPG
jgi:hypothetical protein